MNVQLDMILMSVGLALTIGFFFAIVISAIDDVI